MRALDVAAAGFGVAWMVQLVPVQRSASVWVLAGRKELPTAMRTMAEGHDTPVRKLLKPVQLSPTPVRVSL